MIWHKTEAQKPKKDKYVLFWLRENEVVSGYRYVEEDENGKYDGYVDLNGNELEDVPEYWADFGNPI